MSSVTDFSAYNLSPSIMKALAGLKFSQPTPIQREALPIVLQGRDLIACAQTGSGKTAAFSIPLLEKLSTDSESKILVLTPTRELAGQIDEVITTLAKFLTGVRVVRLVGGADLARQEAKLRKHPRIIVGTPGRINDHLNRQPKLLNNVRYVVLDEGDRMLDMGFIDQIDEILRSLPRDRQTLIFSATLPTKIRELAQRYMQEPVSVSVGPEFQPVDKVRQMGIEVNYRNRNDVLLDELGQRAGSVMIFTNTKSRTNSVARYLGEQGCSVTQIHGGLTQSQRNQALQNFRDGTYRILVATDVAARGLDIPHVAHVINYDVPQFDEDYVHRVGRTARNGQEGEAVSLVLPHDCMNWSNLVRRFNIPGTPYSQKEKKKSQWTTVAPRFGRRRRR